MIEIISSQKLYEVFYLTIRCIIPPSNVLENCFAESNKVDFI